MPADEDNDDNDALPRRGGDCPYYRPTPVFDRDNYCLFIWASTSIKVEVQ